MVARAMHKGPTPGQHRSNTGATQEQSALDAQATQGTAKPGFQAVEPPGDVIDALEQLWNPFARPRQQAMARFLNAPCDHITSQ